MHNAISKGLTHKCQAKAEQLEVRQIVNFVMDNSMTCTK